MASASIRFFMKDADTVKDVDADQCKRTLSLPLKAFLSEGLVSVRPSARQSMSITSVQVFLGWPGHNLQWDWASELSSTNHNYILHGHAIWVGGCGVPLLDCQAASSPKDPASWLGDDTAHAVNHSSVIALQTMQVRWGFTCMEHGNADAQIVNSSLEVMGNEREVRTGRSSLNLPFVTWHLVIMASSQLPPEEAVPKETELWYHLQLLPTHCDLCH